MKKIYFDMDGTVYDLYGMDNWLEMLRNEERGAFLYGDTLVNMNELEDVCLLKKVIKSVLLLGCLWAQALNIVKFAQKKKENGQKRICRIFPNFTLLNMGHRNNMRPLAVPPRCGLLMIIKRFGKCG